MKKTVNILLTVTINTIIGLLIFIYLLYSKTGQTDSLVSHLRFIIYFALVVNIIALVVKNINRLITQTNPNIKKTGYRFTASFILNYLIFLSISFSSSHIYAYFSSIPFNVFYDDNYESAVRLFILGFYMLLLFLTIDFFIYSFKRYSQNKIKTILQEKDHLSLQLELLKTQLSPHYLFNNLNTISSLVYSDTNLTEKYIRRLAKTYQYILNSDKQLLVPVKQEVEFILDYTGLLKIRYQQALEVKINIEKNTFSNYIPPMCLQVLVENAVKHNVATPEEKLIIEIKSKGNNRIEVCNNITHSPQTITSFNIGIDNLKAQLGFFTNQKVQISNSNQYCVSIPTLKEIAEKHA